MNRKVDEEQVLGISFLTAQTQPLGEFVDFLRQRGHFVSQTKSTVSVSALPGCLEDMAQNVFETSTSPGVRPPSRHARCQHAGWGLGVSQLLPRQRLP